VEPPAGPPAEPGVPGELPVDVVATDAGLTELPVDDASDEAAAGTVVDETLVAQLLADAPPDVEVIVVEESDFEEALADAAAAGAVADGAAGPGVTRAEPAGDDEPTETELVAPDLGVDEPTVTVARGAVAYGDEESSVRIPMPSFSEAPTMEIPAVTDNLRAVRGIGPSMERMLHGLGIISFRQLAMLDGAELERVREELSDFRSRIEREDWVGQARELHKAKYGRDPS
jgi:predicted flap endonuclease-1-like 5' DNA nuclease